MIYFFSQRQIGRLLKLSSATVISPEKTKSNAWYCIATDRAKTKLSPNNCFLDNDESLLSSKMAKTAKQFDINPIE